MSWKPTLWLLAAVVLMALFILVFEKGTQMAGLPATADEPLLGFEPGNVTRVEVSTPAYRAECALRHQRWYLTSPVETRADDGRVRRIIEALRQTRRHETIPPAVQAQRGLTAASFGLETPRGRCVLGYNRGQDELALGADAPLGNLVYVRVNGGADVIGATREVESVFPGSVDELRDRAVFPASVERASRIEIKQAGGFVQLALRGGEWRIQQPRDERADRARVESLLRTLKGLQVAEYAGEAPLADPVAYGLGPDEAVVQVTVWPEGEPDGITLALGKPKQDNPALVYARISDVAAICAVSNDVLPKLTLNEDGLRDRRLCDADPAAIAAITVRDGEKKLVLERATADGWVITEPIRSRADLLVVGSLLKNLCALQGDAVTGEVASNAAARLMKEAKLKVSVSEKKTVQAAAFTNAPVVADAGLGHGWSFLVGADATGDGGLVFQEEAQTVFRVRRADLDKVLPRGETLGQGNGADPLLYMDRRVLDLDGSNVRRLTVAKMGREETLIMDAGGNWSVDSPPGARMAEGAASALLALGTALQAVRIESLSATNSVRYGIDETSPRVTFGLTGTGGIQKTVLLGGDDGHNGVYAMVQGRDVVFVLRRTATEALTRSLVASP